MNNKEKFIETLSPKGGKKLYWIAATLRKSQFLVSYSLSIGSCCWPPAKACNNSLAYLAIWTTKLFEKCL